MKNIYPLFLVFGFNASGYMPSDESRSSSSNEFRSMENFNEFDKFIISYNEINELKKSSIKLEKKYKNLQKSLEDLNGVKKNLPLNLETEEIKTIKAEILILDGEITEKIKENNEKEAQISKLQRDLDKNDRKIQKCNDQDKLERFQKDRDALIANIEKQGREIEQNKIVITNKKEEKEERRGQIQNIEDELKRLERERIATENANKEEEIKKIKANQRDTKKNKTNIEEEIKRLDQELKSKFEGINKTLDETYALLFYSQESYKGLSTTMYDDIIRNYNERRAILTEITREKTMLNIIETEKNFFYDHCLIEQEHKEKNQTLFIYIRTIDEFRKNYADLKNPISSVDIEKMKDFLVEKNDIIKKIREYKNKYMDNLKNMELLMNSSTYLLDRILDSLTDSNRVLDSLTDSNPALMCSMPQGRSCLKDKDENTILFLSTQFPVLLYDNDCKIIIKFLKEEENKEFIFFWYNHWGKVTRIGNSKIEATLSLMDKPLSISDCNQSISHLQKQLNEFKSMDYMKYYYKLYFFLKFNLADKLASSDLSPEVIENKEFILHLLNSTLDLGIEVEKFINGETQDDISSNLPNIAIKQLKDVKKGFDLFAARLREYISR